MSKTEQKIPAAKKALQEAKKKKAAQRNPQVKFTRNYGTSQIYSSGFEFAFMSQQEDVWTQACTFVYCKDFLHDAVWAAVNQTQWGIYGFEYNAKKDVPLDRDYCALAFRNTAYKGREEEFHAQRKACQAFLNGVEKKLGFKKSKIHQVEHEKVPCWLIIGDKSWQHAPPLVGFFTLFIRLGFMHNLERKVDETLQLAKEEKIKIGSSTSYAGNRDSSYIKQAWEGLQVLFKHNLGVFHEKMEDNYPQDLPNRGPSLHDHYGPVNFSKKCPKEAMPHWYRSEIWDA